MPDLSAHWSAITIDCADPPRLARFWAELLGWEPSESLPGWVRLGAVGGGGPVLNFQPVPEPKRGKNRVHVDVTVDDADQAVATVTELGGRWTGERHDYDEGAVLVMADPEGNEFCATEYYQ